MADGLDDIREVFAARLDELGLSPSAVSRRATGQPDTLRKFLKEGVTPGANKIRSVCAELGLEFYVGPKRTVSAPSSEPTLDENLTGAVERAVERVLGDRLRDVVYTSRLEHDVALLFELKSLAQAIREDAERRGKPLSFDQIKAKMRAILDDDGAGPNLADQTEQ